MPDTSLPAKSAAVKTEHFDVLIIGAGISGIGGAYHLRQQLPGKTFVMLEEHESFGGTWITHKYPGIRSDSDLYTFGYRFKPWTGKPIAKAQEILDYMGEVTRQMETGQRTLGEIIDHDDLMANYAENAIPEHLPEVEAGAYPEFLAERRKLMAAVIRGYYERL